MPLFGKSKEQKAREATAALLAKVPLGARLLARPLLENLGISDSETLVKAEVLGLLCHLVARWAFAIGGPQFRAQLQDMVTPHAVDAMVESSWDASHADPGFNFEEWKDQVKGEVLHNVNVTESEYSECKSLMGSEEEKETWMFKDDNIIGRFVGNITRLSGSDPVSNSTIVAALTIQFLADLGIRRDIEEIWRNIQ